MEQILHAMRLSSEAVWPVGDVVGGKSSFFRQSEEESQRGIHCPEAHARLVESEHLFQHQTQAAGELAGNFSFVT